MLTRVSASPPERTHTRRAVLSAGTGLTIAAAGMASGCSRTRVRPPTPRETLLDATLTLEDEVIAACDAAVQAAPRRSALARTLADVRAAHATHRETLVAAGAQAGLSATPSPSATPAPTSHEALQTLIATETAAAAIRTGTCVTAPRDLAPLLASLAASEAAHVALLRAPV
jgi:hypothetical protein